MISGLDWPQKILEALLGFYTVFDCLWSCISYFFSCGVLFGQI